MSDTKLLVSIALCTYNGEKYLAQQLDSLVKQDYTNLEIVILDDFSTDATIQILKSYEKKNSEITLIQNSSNIGFNKNFEKALSYCSGQYIAIADQDDVWMQNKITIMMEHIGDNLLLYHNSNYINENGFLMNKSTQTHHRFISGYCAKNLIYYNCVSGHSCLISKKLLTITPPFPVNFYYDWWLAYTAACAGKIDYLNLSLVNHRLHNHSTTARDNCDSKSGRIYHLNLFINHNGTPDTLKKLLVRLMENYQNQISDNISQSLFILLFKNAKQLFFIRKKSLFSEFKFIINESRK